MDAAVRNMVSWAGVSVPDALTMATTTPATLLGLPNLGRLAAGNAADLTTLSPDLHVIETWIAGQPVEKSSIQGPESSSH